MTRLVFGVYGIAALALVLPAVASAEWGEENWGEMVWGATAFPIPAMSIEALLALALLALLVPVTLMARRRRGART